MQVRRLVPLVVVPLALALLVPRAASARGAADHSLEFQQMQASMAELAQQSGQDFEVAYINRIIPHHQAAIAMAQMVLSSAPHQDVRMAAAQIIQDQQREINELTQWLATWYGLSVTPDPRMQMSQAMMSAMMHADPTLQEQLFLAMMREHHQSAIEMGQLALQKAIHAELRTQAQQMLTSQQQEQAQFGAWLQAWYGITAPLPSGDMQHGMNLVLGMQLPDTGAEGTAWSQDTWGRWATLGTSIVLLVGGGYLLRRKLA
jgi:uncharacterized protein (DUF305 family)